VFVLDTGGGAYFPVASGTALPGATVAVSTGGATTPVTADATTGEWSATAPVAAEAPSVSKANTLAATDLGTADAGDVVDPGTTEQAGTASGLDTTDSISATDAGGDSNTTEQTVQGATVQGTISVTQTADGVTSAAATAPYSLTSPMVSVQGVFGNGSPIIRLSTSGLAGAQTEIFVDGELVTPIVIRDGEDYLLVGKGTHDIAVRYADGSGRFGPSTHVTVTVGLVDAGS
jgi:hypothetical protein